MFQTVIFDLDGTLLDTLEDLANAANYVCRQNEWPERSIEECRTFVGDGVLNFVKRVAPEWEKSPLITASATQLFCEYYDKHDAEFTRPYAGMVELLQELKDKGVKLGIYSNKKHSFCQQLADHYFPGLFMHVQGKEQGGALKPDAEGTNRVLEAIEANPATTLFVGDSVVDMETARNANVKSCAVSWGFRSEAELKAANPDFWVATTSDIRKIVLGA